MIKLLISDLDNTLLYHDKDISYIKDHDRQALALLEQHQIRFMVASGRHYGFVKDYLAQYQLKGDIIGANGATAFINQQLVINHLADTKALRRVFAYLSAQYPRIYLKVSTPDNQEYRYDTIGRHYPEDEKVSLGLRAFLAQPDIQVNRFVVSCESTGLFRIVQDDLRQRFGTYFEFNQSAKDLMDVTPAGIDKGTAVKEVLKLLGYDRLEAAAIGDSYNDIAMLEAVGTSFAMASGEEITKRTADHVVHDLAEAVAMIIKNT